MKNWHLIEQQPLLSESTKIRPSYRKKEGGAQRHTRESQTMKKAILNTSWGVVLACQPHFTQNYIGKLVGSSIFTGSGIKIYSNFGIRDKNIRSKNGTSLKKIYLATTLAYWQADCTTDFLGDTFPLPLGVPVGRKVQKTT